MKFNIFANDAWRLLNVIGDVINSLYMAFFTTDHYQEFTCNSYVSVLYYLQHIATYKWNIAKFYCLHFTSLWETSLDFQHGIWLHGTTRQREQFDDTLSGLAA